MSRAIACLAGLGCALISGSLFAEFPYSAVVTTDSAEVHCGPRADYYATARLQRGAKIEVYRRSGQWLAVRPTDADFSWVDSRFLRDRVDGSVEVVDSAAVAWIGTSGPTPANLKWQVKLKKGELLTFRGRRNLAAVAGDPVSEFVKISPPAGEFRWIEARHVEKPAKRAPTRQNAIQLVSHQRVESSTSPTGMGTLVPATGLKWRSAKRANTTDHRIADVPADPPRRDVRTASRQNMSSGQTTTSRRPLDSPPAATSPTPAIASPTEVAGARPTPSTALVQPPLVQPPRIQPPLASGGSGRSADRLSLELASIATKSPEQWELKSLRDRAVQIVQDESDVLERGKARLLIERIDAFRFLKQRRENVLSAKAGGLRAGEIDTSPADLSNAIGLPKKATSDSLLALSELPKSVTARANRAVGSGVAPASFDSPERSPYQATGWLSKVITRSRGVPPYALVNRNNDIICFLTPHPGFNLHRYLKEEIGVIGNRSTYGSRNTPHVQVRRVVNLARHRRTVNP